jgi:hypothetical protein
MFKFAHWAQPVVSRRWAVICTVLDWGRRLSGHRVLNRSTHKAWERACGIA